MTGQELLFQPHRTETMRVRPPHQVGSDTSRAGADHVEPQAASLRGMVLAELRRAGATGGTIEELTRAVAELRGRPMKEGSTCGRIGELRRLRLIRDSGRRRRGCAGVSCVVWVVIDGGGP